MSSRSEPVYRFESFQLDPVRRVLTRDGTPVPVTPKALELLIFLVERRGTVVEKEAILHGLWPNTTVEEGNITVNVSLLRRALGESRAEHRFIVTVPGRGYQFVADVTYGSDEPARADAPQPAALRAAAEERRRLAVRHLAGWGAAAAALLILLTVVVPAVSTRGNGTSGSEPEDVEARALYVKGRFFLNKRTAEGLYRALDHFEQAVRRSPAFAPAHAGIADAHNMLAYFGLVRSREAFPRAEAAAREALRLDRRLAEAHTSLAYVSHRFHWDWTAAETGFRRAIELDPDSSTARHWYAAFLESMGRDEEALVEARRAQTLDPLALVIGANLGTMLGSASRLQESMEQCHKLLEMDTTFWPAHWTLARTYASLRRHDEAAREFEAAANLSGRIPYMLGELGEFYVLAGQPSKAVDLLAELEDRSQREYVPSFYRAVIHAALGERDRAFARLDEALAERSASLVFLRIKRNFETLRSDPRFAELLQKVGLLG